MKIYIYKIICPITKEVRYIGKTINLQRRIYQHTCKSGRLKNRHLSNWINKLYKEFKLKPVFKIVEIVNKNNWQEREIFWINFYRTQNKLCNHTNGGEGCHGRKMSEELKKKISKTHKGKKKNYKCVGGVKVHKEETKKRISIKKKNNNCAEKPLILYRENIPIKIFKSSTEASQITEISISAISNNLKGLSKKTKIGIWKKF